jgi:hypothetical protein
MAPPSDDKKKKPPYARYAFLNPYNLAMLGGIASASALTGNWWLGLFGAGVEALWMLFAPDSKLLQMKWFDKVFAAEQDAERKKELEAKFAALPEDERMRCMALQEKQAQIDRLAKENPAFAVELLGTELGKLDSLVKSFIELALTCARYQDYLESVDLSEIESDIRRYTQTIERAGKEADKRQLAQKNLAVLEKRKEKYAEIRNYLSSARGQMDLMENTFRLLADQIVTMRSPTELGGQLDDLLDGVEAVRQTTRETDKILQAIER